MKHILRIFITTWLCLHSAIALATNSDSIDTRTKVRFETTAGAFTIALFDDTPLHRDNFIKLVNEHFYDSLLIHRSVFEFVIQTGDPNSRYANPGDKLGEGAPDYEIPAEIIYPKYAHFRGAVGAAREGDAINPERRSCASQFYVVWGKRFSKGMMQQVRKLVTERTSPPVVIPEAFDSLYWERAGTPTLDGQYTIFGEILDGWETIDEIQFSETDENQRPLKDYRIIKAYILPQSKQ